MKILPLFAAAGLFAFLFFTTTGITSCTKTRTVYDTTYITVHDTTVIKDSATDLTTGLVAYFSFKGGSLKDGSGHGNDIVFNNATQTADRFGNANNAYLFDGSSNYMQVKNSGSLNPNNITIYAIIKVNGFYTGLCSGNEIVAKGNQDDINGFYNLRYTDFSVSCGTPNLNNETFGGGYGDNVPKGTAVGTVGATPIKTGQWYYVAYTYDGQASKLYVNGELAGFDLKKVNFTPNSDDLFIGKLASTTYPYFVNGVIDEVRIYNRALPECAITHLISVGD